MKTFTCLVALVCLVLAAPALAEEPSFLTDAPDLVQSLDVPEGACDQASVDRFPGADQAFMAACTITTTCTGWSYTCPSSCSNRRAKRTRTCEDKCCNSSGQCISSGSYTQSECTPLSC
jgi:hypothetical protein